MKHNRIMLALLGLSLWFVSGLSYAFNPQPDPPAHIGMVGLVADQTLRLNIRAVKLAATDVLPGPCRVSLNFTDSSGNLLNERGVIRTLQPGQASFLDLVGIEDPNIRKQVHPVVRVLPNLLPSIAPCVGISATLESFETLTGTTSWVIPDFRIYKVEDPDI